MNTILWLSASLLALQLSCKPPAAAAPRAEAEPKRVRPPASAGQFYPADPAELQAKVAGYLEKAQRVVGTEVPIVLTPHAGLEFSGQVAAWAFKQLSPGFTRAVIVAGNHNGDALYEGVSYDRATHYDVPGLEVKVASANAGLFSLPGFVDVPAAHAMHMIEIELPFLEALNRPEGSVRPGAAPAAASFEIVPLVIGSITREQTRAIAATLAKLADGKTVFVFSIDLSHYYPYDRAVALDQPCLAALERMDADAVATCTTDATQALLVMTELAALLDATPRLITYANSGDVTSERSRVVGYGALAYEARYDLGPEEQAELLRLARRGIEARVGEGREPALPAGLLWRYPRLRQDRGAFVTLKEHGALRGCIGTLRADRPLAQDVLDNAVNAAVRDGRFRPVSPEELAELELSISVLDSPRPMANPGPDALPALLGRSRPGLILSYSGRASTFLPEVWDELPDPLRFLGQLCRKQGSPEDCWRDPATQLATYGTFHFAEGEPGPRGTAQAPVLHGP